MHRIILILLIVAPLTLDADPNQLWTLSCDKNADHADSDTSFAYEFNYETGGTVKKIATQPTCKTQFTPVGLGMQLSTHIACFTATAINKYGRSDPSDPVCEEVTPGRPGKPLNLNLVAH